MFVSTTEPFKLIYSLFEHEYLGFLLESYAVQLNARGEVTFRTQNVSSKNIKEFAAGIEPDDLEIVKLTDAIQQEVIYKKFNTKKLTQEEFFNKVFDKENGDKILKESILGYIERYKSEIFSKIKSKNFFIMGSDGVVTWKEVEIVQQPAKAYFHFERQATQTVYYPIIKCGDEKIKFQFKNAKIINDLPAALLVDEKLYLFDQYADGKKIRPFLNKPNIIIPKKLEDTYYQKFIVPLVANFNVFASGFEIRQEKENAAPRLMITEHIEKQETFFSTNGATSNVNKLVFDLSFFYGNRNFRYENFSPPSYVFLEKNDDSWLFHKIKKDLEKEKETLLFLKNIGLDIKNGKISMEKSAAITWLSQHHEALEEYGISVVQNTQNSSNYFFGYSNIDLKIDEKNDWFDVHALVQFGEFEIPFSKLRKNILNKIKEFELPNGQVAIIPEAWFTTYSDLFYNLEIGLDENFTIKKHHYAIVNHLDEEGLAVTTMNRKLQGLKILKKFLI